MVGILEEGDGIVSEFKGSQALDAAVIAAAQKVEHYEIATYGCLQEWAGMLGLENAAAVFEEILSEEKGADESLTEIARTMANEMAESGEDEEDDEDATAEADEEEDDDDEENDEPNTRRRSNRR
jgi:ferritin-like metal-binding protein YciE